MNFTLALLDIVTRVLEKWKTLLMMANGYSTNALFLDILLLRRMLHMLSLKPLSALVIVASYPPWLNSEIALIPIHGNALV